MGDWAIVIHGTGVHHNTQIDLKEDADKMFDDLVRVLEEAGHTVRHAEFTYGGTKVAR